MCTITHAIGTRPLFKGPGFEANYNVSAIFSDVGLFYVCIYVSGVQECLIFH